MRNGLITCQSCGLLYDKLVHAGTNADGTNNLWYCDQCFQYGVFTEQDITLEEMQSKSYVRMLLAGYSKGLADSIISSIKLLNRWT